VPPPFHPPPRAARLPRPRRHYYDSPHYPALRELYYEFVRRVVLPLFAEDERVFAVQRDPSFRVNLPNNTAVGWRPGAGDPSGMVGIHCDADCALGVRRSEGIARAPTHSPSLPVVRSSADRHPSGEINFILPFTDMFGSNSVWTESAPGKADWAAAALQYGSFFRFYGNRQRHFNTVNRSGRTRVSVDFRVVPWSHHDEAAGLAVTSLHSTRRFTTDAYYVRMER
jgi:hypothetical protein